MATLLTADLPSSDEEDDAYDPTKDPTGEREDGGGGGPARRSKRPRRAAAAAAGATAAGGGEDDDDDDGGGDLLAAGETRTQQVKRARAAELFEKIKGEAKPPGGAAAPAGAAAAPAPAPAAASSSKPFDLAALCRPTNTATKQQQHQPKKMGSDELWMRNLGLAPAPKPAAAVAGAGAGATGGGGGSAGVVAAIMKAARGAAVVAATPLAPEAAAVLERPAAGSGDNSTAPAAAVAGPSSSAGGVGEQPGHGGSSGAEAACSAAAAALAAAKEAASLGVAKSYNKIAVKETRRFAGKDIEVTLHVEAGSKAAKEAAKRAATRGTGIERFLADIEAKKRVNVLDKTKMDWQEMKAGDLALEEELEAHKRSGAQYLDKREFLERTELREYEIERDRRLAADVRTRGRL